MALGLGKNYAAQHSSSPNQPLAEQDSHFDGSETLLKMYMMRAMKEDMEMAERWKADAESILVFSGLFSATVATAIGLTFSDLKPDPQDTSNFYLANIYQLLANGSQVTITTALPDPPAFSPSLTAVWVNSLWFLSLVISLTCAVFAIMLQQWAHSYLTAARPRYTLLKNARIRELLAEGVMKFRLPVFAGGLLAFHHASFFLFIAGLAVLLFNTNHTTFFIIAGFILFLIISYIFLTCLPMIQSNSPYYTPLSPTIWSIIRTFLAAFRLLAVITYPGFERTSWGRLVKAYRKRLHQGRRKAMEESAQKHSQKLDENTLLWTFKSLNDDQALEQFISGVPSFCNSKAIRNPLGCLAKLDEGELFGAILTLMHHTLTSNDLESAVKKTRIRVCNEAIDAVPVPASWQTLSRVFEEWDGLLTSVDFGHFVMSYVDDNACDNAHGITRSIPRKADSRADFCIRCIIAVMIARLLQQSDRHSDLVTLLCITDDLRSLEGRTNVQLANLTFITRQIVQFRPERSRDALLDVSYKTLDELEFNVGVQHASPGLQRDFCSLWNELVHGARDGADAHVRSNSTKFLRRFRRSYIDFHGNTDPTIPTAFYESTDDRNSILSRGSTYPLCSGHLIPLHPAPHHPERTTNASRGTTIASIHPPAITHPAHPVQATTVPAVSLSHVPIPFVRSSSGQLHFGTPDPPDPNRSSTTRGTHRSAPGRALSRSSTPIASVRSPSAPLHFGTPDPNRSSTTRGTHKSAPGRK
ncbi:hypothetical protein EDB87DRAFT_729833 [Lactarius vividus]|nr:hypothetical protein EDB87DRAFT_729833 [Lactarius vividus]